VTDRIPAPLSTRRPDEQAIAERAHRERQHFNAHTTADGDTLTMAAANIRRYAEPPANTAYSLEYAFHLIGPVAGRRILNIGCGDGLDAVILGSLGAQVIAVDIADAAIALTSARATANELAGSVTALVADATTLPVASGSIDGVLAAAVMHHVDIPHAAAELRRVLRPGGVAVFVEPCAGPRIVELLKRWVPLPHAAELTEDERALTPSDVTLISTTIGRVEASRRFGLTARLVKRLAVHRLAGAAYRFDRWALSHSRMLAAVASPLVWSVRKPA
jgi:SAM-dependent methyltransferase